MDSATVRHFRILRVVLASATSVNRLKNGDGKNGFLYSLTESAQIKWRWRILVIAKVTPIANGTATSTADPNPEKYPFVRQIYASERDSQRALD